MCADYGWAAEQAHDAADRPLAREGHWAERGIDIIHDVLERGRSHLRKTVPCAKLGLWR